MQKINKIKGTADIYNTEIELFNKIDNIFRKVSKKYGYNEIITPVLEYTKLFNRGIGETTDIVEKEMFTFTDNKKRQISLRPENTAGVARAYIENSFFNESGVQKLFYSGPMFRKEKPQAGRQRQFFQLGCEAFGSDSYILDSENIMYAYDFLKQIDINFNLLTLNISSVGCPECRKKYNKILIDFLKNSLSELCDNCQNRADRNPLRVFDCKNEQCSSIIENAPKIIDNLCESCNENFNSLINILDNNNIKYVINKKLVRGLDYYTKTVFEFTYSDLGAQNTILAGGRYNNLVKELGGPDIPAIGWAAGMERLILCLKNSFKTNKNQQVFIVYDKTVINEMIKLSQELRDNGIETVIDYDRKKLSKQFKAANKLNMKYILILGEYEVAENKIKLKNFDTSEEFTFNRNEIINKLKNIIGKSPNP